MEKQVVKVVVLSLAVLIGWHYLMVYLNPPKPETPPIPATATQPATENAPKQPTEQPVAASTGEGQPSAPVVVEGPPEPERTITVRTSRWEAQFSNRGAVPVSWKLTMGPDNRPIKASDGSDLELIPSQGVQEIGAPLRLGVSGDPDSAARLTQAVYRVESEGAAVADTVTVEDGKTVELSFVVNDPASNQTVTKKFAFTGGEYDLGLTVDSSAGARQFDLLIGPRIGDQSVKTEGSYSHTPPHAVVVSPLGSVNTIYGTSVKDGELYPVSGQARWAGITDNYFAMVASVPPDAQGGAVVSNKKMAFAGGDPKPHDFLTVSLPFVSGRPVHIFVGPKDPGVLEAVGERATRLVGAPTDYSNLINYGFFAFLIRPIIPVIDLCLRATNQVTGNYGWSIIIITALFNFLFFPLKYKSSVAMKRAAKLQPRMKELQEKMKKVKPNDPEFRDLQREQIDLMKQGNPLGGCLPLLLQFPFFWAFFIYFTTSFIVRQQPWVGWIHDLTSPDPFYILPIIMCVTQIGSMFITPMPASDDPAMKFQRTLMTWVMPVVFTYFFFLAAPTGLVLYWMTLNLVGIATQQVINRMMPPDVVENDQAPTGGSKKAKNAKKEAPREVGSEA